MASFRDTRFRNDDSGSGGSVRTSFGDRSVPTVSARDNGADDGCDVAAYRLAFHCFSNRRLRLFR